MLVVDEAGMVGTRDLARLLAATEEAHAKLVLVGDDRQLPEIQTGGLFSALADRLGALELTEIRRQDEAWDRVALAALRDGDVDSFARPYYDHGRVVAAPTADAARAALVNDWWAIERGDQALMIAHRRSDVADLNRRAREHMRAAGRLDLDVLITGGRAFAVGDRVLTTRNDRRIGVVNGDCGTLTGIGRGTLSVELDRGARVELPDSYARDGQLEHGYASTAHRAQGATVDAAFVLGSDELYREWGYTALSRHRDAARFYVTAKPAFLNAAPEPLRDADLPRRVARMLKDSRAEHLALHGVIRDGLRPLLIEQIERAAKTVADTDAAIESLAERREGTRWYEGRRRAGIDHATAEHQSAREHWQHEVDRLTADLAERAEPRKPTLWCARDPLTGSIRPPGSAASRCERVPSHATTTSAWISADERAQAADARRRDDSNGSRRGDRAVTDLPPRVRAEAQRIFDSAARRLLAEQLDRDSVGAVAGGDGHALAGGTDQRPLLVEVESVPIGSVDRDRGARAA